VLRGVVGDQQGCHSRVQPASDKTLVTACDISACRTCTTPLGALLALCTNLQPCPSHFHQKPSDKSHSAAGVSRSSVRPIYIPESPKNTQTTKDETQDARTIRLRTSQHIPLTSNTQDASALIRTQHIANAAGSITSTALFPCCSTSHQSRDGTQ